jgi:hypothetical protein
MNGRRRGFRMAGAVVRLVAAALPAEDQPVEPGEGTAQAEPDQHQQWRQVTITRGDAGEMGAEVLDMGEVALAEDGDWWGELHEC